LPLGFTVRLHWAARKSATPRLRSESLIEGRTWRDRT
jgi:hypothetical protein